MLTHEVNIPANSHACELKTSFSRQLTLTYGKPSMTKVG